jgi:hypothetical protein
MRRAIQNSKESLKKLSEKYSINKKTKVEEEGLYARHTHGTKEFSFYSA